MAAISVLIANAKGGCGKTTLATNLASAFANAGLKTALAEGDRQRSSLQWLKRRPDDVAQIEGLDWRDGPGKVPKKVQRLVIDAPAGVTSKRMHALLECADLVVMPVLPSVFDEVATRRFLKKVDDLKPVRKGLKPVAIVANRVRPNTRAAKELHVFLQALGHDVATRFTERAIYPDVARQGLGIFDLAPSRRKGAVDDWLPLVRLIEDRA
ncbi:division plane positioning ATPase MipZ [Minwuia sp.]|uniref:nucleotide-binding protein n=1 Tax=Minwuia sp. TaxID=2493630 RepID=UPI003A9461A6